MPILSNCMMVCHLELYGQHFYFGNLKVLTDHFPKEVLCVGYNPSLTIL